MDYEKIFKRALKRYNVIQGDILVNEHLVIGGGLEEFADEHAKWNLADLIDEIEYQRQHHEMMIYGEHRYDLRFESERNEYYYLKRLIDVCSRYVKTYEKYLGGMKPYHGKWNWYNAKSPA